MILLYQTYSLLSKGGYYCPSLPLRIVTDFNSYFDYNKFRVFVKVVLPTFYVFTIVDYCLNLEKSGQIQNS